MSARRDFGHWPLPRPLWWQLIETGGWVFLFLAMVFACGYIVAVLQDHEPPAPAVSIQDRVDADCYRRPRKITPACDGHWFPDVPE